MTEKTKPGFPGEPPSERPVAVEPFAATLERHGLSLVRGEVHTLQINTGFLCNLRCRHCHLEAGPDRREVMSREIMSAVIAFAERFRFQAIDITGDAPEMIPVHLLPHRGAGTACSEVDAAHEPLRPCGTCP